MCNIDQTRRSFRMALMSPHNDKWASFLQTIDKRDPLSALKNTKANLPLLHSSPSSTVYYNQNKFRNNDTRPADPKVHAAASDNILLRSLPGIQTVPTVTSLSKRQNPRRISRSAGTDRSNFAHASGHIIRALSRTFGIHLAIPRRQSQQDSCEYEACYCLEGFVDFLQMSPNFC